MDKDKLTEKVLEYLNSAEAFLEKEVPVFFTKYVNFLTWEVQYSFSISLVVMGVSFIVLISTIIAITTDSIDEVLGILFTVFSLIALLVSFMCLFSTYKDMKELELSPKSFLIKTIKSQKI